MSKKKLSVFTALLSAALLLSACSGSSASNEASSTTGTTSSAVSSTSQASSTAAEEVTLRVGASPAPHAEILEQIVDTLAQQGITLEIVVFDDYPVQNAALAEGSLDANYFQHYPYLEDYNEKNGTDLISAGVVHVEPMGVYAGKSDDLTNIPTGAVIGVPDDATNEARALLLLESLGLITLDADAGIAATPLDITENPYELSFVEVGAEQLPASLPDLDFAVINGNYAIAAGVNDKVIANEGADSPYANVVAVRNGDETRPEIQALLDALHSEEVRTFITETYGGEVLPVF